jgi:hypothetical protein
VFPHPLLLTVFGSVRKFSTVPVLYPKGAELELELEPVLIKPVKTGKYRFKLVLTNLLMNLSHLISYHTVHIIINGSMV